MAPLKIIGAGFGRTGTDSLREALNILGYNTHHMKAMFMDPEQDFDDFYYAYVNKEADWDRIYKKYDAAVDWPTCTFYKELMEKYPEAKVILTVRTADSWYQSCKKTICCPYDQSTLDNEKANKFKRMTTTLHPAIKDPEKFADVEYIKSFFLNHIEEVKYTVPADRLYVMQLGEGWDGLCKFLGKDVPDVPYPKTNSSEEFKTFFTTLKPLRLVPAYHNYFKTLNMHIEEEDEFIDMLLKPGNNIMVNFQH